MAYAPLVDKVSERGRKNDGGCAREGERVGTGGGRVAFAGPQQRCSNGTGWHAYTRVQLAPHVA
eukprot:49040-Rhodomonas_salina.2